MALMMRPSDLSGGLTKGLTSTAFGIESTQSSCRMQGDSDGLILSTVNTGTTPLDCGERRRVAVVDDDMRQLSDRTGCTARGEYTLSGRDSHLLETGSMGTGYERL